MINLHVYPSPITNESRIEREVATIGSLGIFSGIEVAGVSAPGLADSQPLGDYARVRRFAAEPASHGLLARAGKTLVFGREVLRHYSSEPLAVINCHSVAALPACVVLKRRTGARLVYDTHELETETASAVGLRRLVFKASERWGVGDVDHTFTVSKSIEDWYRANRGLTDIDTVYNFPSRAQIGRAPDKQYFRRLFDLPDSIPIYLYQGILAPGRGIEMVSRAFARSEVHGVIVFLGFGPLEVEVKQWAADSPRVFFHPAVPPGELGSLTGAADVGLVLTVGSECLSHYYSAPNKLFQYWHAGIPVVASRLPEFERFMRRYPAGALSDSDSVESFVDACVALSRQDPAEIASGIANANRDLRWETYFDLFKRRYEQLARSTRREH